MPRRRRNKRSTEDESLSPSDDKREQRDDKREDKQTFKVDKTQAKADLQRAKASKWKWLFMLIALIAAIMGYFKFKIPGIGG